MIGDPFSVLGISPEATLREAEAAYRRLVELFHPDRLEGLREQVREEGAARMRDATDAIHAVRARFGRPLIAPGHEHSPSEPNQAESSPRRDHQYERRPWRGAEAKVPISADAIDGGMLAHAPSDAATEAEAHLYDVDLRALDGPELHVHWTGRHAGAVLAALRHGHRIDGAIRQVEWGTYSVSLDGAAARRLVCSVLEDDAWRQDRVVVMQVGRGYSEWMPPTSAEGKSATIELGSLVNLFKDEHWYQVLADVY